MRTTAPTKSRRSANFWPKNRFEGRNSFALKEDQTGFQRLHFYKHRQWLLSEASLFLPLRAG